MNSDSVRVHLGLRSYDISIGTGNLESIGMFSADRAKGRSALIVADEHTSIHATTVEKSLKAAGFRVASVVRPSGEDQKSLASAEALYEALLNLPADRKSLVVAVGGGVVGDLAGFAAATFARGISLVMVPTTLLAMVDSSVGGKVGVNLPRAKNMVGSFHQPLGVLIDSAVLDTLPDREYRSGLAEVVKYGVIMDADFFDFQEKNISAILSREPLAVRKIVKRCCELKAYVVERDEREETGLRAILNYGHTFAHAFETAGGYGAWLHGEAVAAGMICASRLAERRGLVDASLTERQVQLLRAFSLPIQPKPWPAAELIATMRNDKKSEAGKLRFILPTKMGEVKLFSDVPEAEVAEILESMANGVGV